ncbi:MAG: hypothetical protein WD011_01165 [Nitriliruptoraceae bacterium]
MKIQPSPPPRPADQRRRDASRSKSRRRVVRRGPASRRRTVWCPRAVTQDGSLVTEYGLLAVVAATIAGAVMQWATGGALMSLFNALLSQARSLVGA